ncbi:hypothetical protein GCM10007362_12170 [Saccharibacillus endophyticus]|uniref:50S ribosomal protein L35 n=1 Tax=Saccharibacillus endophyticus TaxID=2060666 RepID=A0ABQ1ZPI9_9BACL|nr:hypothetical protein GCM10007362_12170 [Saccharibacillus endophyticus]
MPAAKMLKAKTAKACGSTRKPKASDRRTHRLGKKKLPGIRAVCGTFRFGAGNERVPDTKTYDVG